MNYKYTCVLALAVALAMFAAAPGPARPSSQPAAQPAPKILLNSIGFLPGAEKRASIPFACKSFNVIRISDGKTVFTADATGPAHNADTNQDLYTADFSTLKDPGKYRLDVAGVGPSPEFSIAADVYNTPFYVATRAMYLWRCGTAVTAVYNGHTYHHDACHTDDAWTDAVNGQHEKIDETGGWHDAGDYNKYVVNAGITVGCMFRAWDDFGENIKNFKLDIPETGGKIPDFLAEIKWEMDWILKMQAADGSVYFKVSTKSFGGFILPEKEKEPRYVTPQSTAAAADFVAMTAAAARYYKPYDAAYADQCLAAARKSYAYLQANPQNIAANQNGFSTGTYTTTDPDDRLWAAAELWETTGDADALKDLETRLVSIRTPVQANWDWGSVQNLGFFTYALSKRDGRNADLLKAVRDSVVSVADGIVATDRAHGYNRPLGTAYVWGGNGTVARQTINLMVANRLSPKPEYTRTAQDALGYLFGRNVYGRSFVTGLGNLPPMHPHHRPSGGDNIDDPWPGYLVGGPQQNASDWVDVEARYQVNEVAINWQAPLLYALAAFVKPETH